MKVLIAFFALSVGLYSFTTINRFNESDLDKTFNIEEVVATESLEKVELEKISAALNGVEVSSANVYTMKDGGTFLEYTTVTDGKSSTFKTFGLEGLMVPPCHCGPGSDGIYNAWWEGKTPYRYNKPYCLACAVHEFEDSLD